MNYVLDSNPGLNPFILVSSPTALYLTASQEIRSKTHRVDNRICSEAVLYKNRFVKTITQKRRKNGAGIKNNATQHEHIPSSVMLNEVNPEKTSRRREARMLGLYPYSSITNTQMLQVGKSRNPLEIKVN